MLPILLPRVDVIQRDFVTSCQPCTRRQRYFWHLFTGNTLHMVLVLGFINLFACCSLLDSAPVLELRGLLIISLGLFHVDGAFGYSL